jgi:hypothetical protein
MTQDTQDKNQKHQSQLQEYKDKLNEQFDHQTHTYSAFEELSGKTFHRHQEQEVVKM